MKPTKTLLALLFALIMLAAACGDSSSDGDTAAGAGDDDAEEAPADDGGDDEADDAMEEEGDADHSDGGDDAMEEEADDAMEEEADDSMEEESGDGDAAGAMPGEGVDVTMARATWSTGYFQAEVYKIMMEELGYNVSEPSDLELDPSLAFLSMSEGDFDFWVNSWYPGHLSWHEAERPDGTKVGDHITRVGNEMAAGGLQGFLITKSWAEENGVNTLDQLYGDPALAEQMDIDGNGVADLYGCPEGWTCDNIINEMVCQSGWTDSVEQVTAGYDSMIAEATEKANAGDPMVIYTWTPSAYITQLIPGDNVMWISVDNEFDDQNCSEQENGDQYAQPNATAEIGEDSCLFNDAGECRLGWTAADIQVTANSDFLAANPAAEALLEAVVMPLIDVAFANVEQDASDGTVETIRGIAQVWVDDNRDLIDPWLDNARAAG